jgi:phosphoglycerol transferase MdoB-like AlkP superfamily enzyme
MPKLNGGFFVFLKVLLIIWILEIVLRLAFAVWQYPFLSASDIKEVLTAFYIGIRFDGRIAAILSLPLIVFTIFSFKWRERICLWLYTLIIPALILIYIGDFAHYAYLALRINFSVFSELKDLKEALGVVWESYPVIPLLILLALTAAGINLAFRRLLRGGLGERIKDRIFSFFIALIFTALLIYGQYTPSAFPLRWSEAYFSGRAEITALALNPAQNIYDTKPKTNLSAYDLDLVKKSYPLVAEFLKTPKDEEGESLRFDRFVEGGFEGLKKPNVVLILMESMSSHKSSFMFEELPTTPFLKELAAQSLYFPNYYASARTTAKAVYSVITGIPDGNRFFASSPRDPMAIDQYTIWEQFQGYKKYFMLGGNASWANIRGVLTNNITGINILEEGYWKSPKIDVWGVSDLDLLKEAHQVFERENEPFFAVILTASFHRPFTVPEGLKDFDYSLPDNDYLERYGFVPEEYLSMRFCDYAVREFFRLAAAAAYYENTIFIITGDHGISEQSPAAPRNYQDMSLHEYQVPLIIHYPKKFPKGVMPQAGGHIDLFPTIAGITEMPYHNTTLGRDLLDPAFGVDRWGFVMRSFQQPVIISKDKCYSAHLKGEGKFYRREGDDISQDWEESTIPPEELDKYKILTLGIQEIARYLLYHNSKKYGEER